MRLAYHLTRPVTPTTWYCCVPMKLAYLPGDLDFSIFRDNYSGHRSSFFRNAVDTCKGIHFNSILTLDKSHCSCRTETAPTCASQVGQGRLTETISFPEPHTPKAHAGLQVLWLLPLNFPLSLKNMALERGVEVPRSFVWFSAP